MFLCMCNKMIFWWLYGHCYNNYMVYSINLCGISSLQELLWILLARFSWFLQQLHSNVGITNKCMSEFFFIPRSNLFLMDWDKSLFNSWFLKQLHSNVGNTNICTFKLLFFIPRNNLFLMDLGKSLFKSWFLKLLEQQCRYY